VDTAQQMTKDELDFALAFVRNVIGQAWIACDDNLVRRVFGEISRREELDTSCRDTLGRWEPSCGGPSHPGRVHLPNLDITLREIQHQMQTSHPDYRVEPSSWPDNKSFALCLTHDVDFVSGKNHSRRLFRRLRRVVSSPEKRAVALYQAAGSMERLVTRLGRPDPIGDFEQWLKLEDQYGFRSTFFFLPSELAKVHVYDMDYVFSDSVTYGSARTSVAEMMRQIDHAGWEIGLHGSYLSAYDGDMLRDQKRQIEEVVRKDVRSIRQHYLRYDVSVTPGLQEAAGLVCDSTQGFSKTTGFRAATSFPYWCWDHARGCVTHVLEIPMAVMDSALFSRVAPDLDERGAVEHCVQLMESVAQVGGCLTLNWHSHNLGNPVYRRAYASILTRARELNAWGRSVSQVYHWWVERERQVCGNRGHC
jgi:peptidoglycan/xylan/chitin deacetylase (PgdA/CDA1 family)